MKRASLTAALWIALGLADAFSQTPQFPKTPVVRKAPAFASWTIQFKYPEDEKVKAAAKATPADPSMAVEEKDTMTVSKTNKTYWERTVFKSGKTEEKWIYQGMELRMVPGTDVITPLSPPTALSPNPDYSDYSRSDFKGLEWVSLDTFEGVRTYLGKPAFQFEAMKDGHKVTAILTADTQLPLFSSDEESLCYYSYNPAPTAALTPPANFLAVIKTHKKGLEALKYHPSPP